MSNSNGFTCSSRLTVAWIKPKRPTLPGLFSLTSCLRHVRAVAGELAAASRAPACTGRGKVICHRNGSQDKDFSEKKLLLSFEPNAIGESGK